MGQLIEIPLDSGANDSADSKLLPDGVLKSVQNMYLRRDGQLEVRPGDQALTMTTPEGTLNAREVVNLNGTLLALGKDLASDPHPISDVYRWLPGEPSPWKPSRSVNFLEPRLSPITGVRNVVSPPSQPGFVSQVSTAIIGDYMCQAWATSANRVSARVVKTDGTLIAEFSDPTSVATQPFALAVAGHYFVVFFRSSSSSNK
jgi:hypothetical protein